jgi:hypothetical protein
MIAAIKPDNGKASQKDSPNFITKRAEEKLPMPMKAA